MKDLSDMVPDGPVRPIGFGEADLDLEREYYEHRVAGDDGSEEIGGGGCAADLQKVEEPPAGYSVCVCGYCKEVKDAWELGWEDVVRRVYVCEPCADEVMRKP